MSAHAAPQAPAPVVPISPNPHPSDLATTDARSQATTPFLPPDASHYTPRRIIDAGTQAAQPDAHPNDDSAHGQYADDIDMDLDPDADAHSETQSECGALRTPEQMTSPEPGVGSVAGHRDIADASPTCSASASLPSGRFLIDIASTDHAASFTSPPLAPPGDTLSPPSPRRTPSPPPARSTPTDCPMTPVVAKRSRPEFVSPTPLSASLLSRIINQGTSFTPPPREMLSRRRSGFSFGSAPQLSTRTVRSPAPSPPPGVVQATKSECSGLGKDVATCRPAPTPKIVVSPISPVALPPLRLSLQSYPVPTPTPAPGPPLHPALDLRPSGVGVLDNRTIRRGEVLVRTDPLCAVLHNKLLETHCSGCLRGPHHVAEERGIIEAKAAKLFLTCTKCEVAAFCSMKCYAKSASTHWAECRAFKRVGAMPADVRLVVRVLWATRRGQAIELPGREVTLSEDTQRTMARITANVLLSLAEGADGTVPWQAYGLDGPHELSGVVKRVLSCHFEVKDYACNPVGICVSPVVGRIAHSCVPTAVLEYPFGTNIDQPLRIIANQDLSSGDEVTISYLDLGLPYHRRATVLEMHGILHHCDACQGTERDERWCARHGCAQDGLVPLIGDGLLPSPHTRCSMCKGQAWVDINRTPFNDIMARVNPYFEAQLQGARRVEVDEDVFAAESRQEAASLTVEVQNLLEAFPDTLYPLGHLRLRLGRLLMDMRARNRTRLVAKYNLAIESLDTALGVMREWFNEESYPILLSIGLSKIECHLRAVAEVIRPLRAHEARQLAEQPALPRSPGSTPPRTTREVEQQLCWLATRKTELEIARTHCQQLLDALSEAHVDGAMLLEGTMAERLARYRRRVFKLENWIKKQSEAQRAEERRLNTERLHIGAKIRVKVDVKRRRASTGLGAPFVISPRRETARVGNAEGPRSPRSDGSPRGRVRMRFWRGTAGGTADTCTSPLRGLAARSLSAEKVDFNAGPSFKKVKLRRREGEGGGEVVASEPLTLAEAAAALETGIAEQRLEVTGGELKPAA